MPILHLKLSADTINNVIMCASNACRYWVPDAYTKTKGTRVEVMWDKFSRDVRKGLKKPIPVHGSAQLKAISNFDRDSTDIIVQLALFGEIRYC